MNKFNVIFQPINPDVFSSIFRIDHELPLHYEPSSCRPCYATVGGTGTIDGSDSSRRNRLDIFRAIVYYCPETSFKTTSVARRSMLASSSVPGRRWARIDCANATMPFAIEWAGSVGVALRPRDQRVAVIASSPSQIYLKR